MYVQSTNLSRGKERPKPIINVEYFHERTLAGVTGNGAELLNI